MKQYIRKPIKVEAIQWTGDNIDDFHQLRCVREWETNKKQDLWLYLEFIDSFGSKLVAMETLTKDQYLVFDERGLFKCILSSEYFKAEYEEVEEDWSAHYLQKAPQKEVEPFIVHKR